MEIINTVKDFESYRNSFIFNNKSIGFIPTMGALHKGHISLVKRSVDENDITIVSVFVNKRQFNDQSDYINYPVTTERDIELLEAENCDILFIPSDEDIYNNYEGHKMDFMGLDKIYEGEFRPGHFQGVVDIVYRLFEIIRPDRAYFGEKDFQQLAIIKLMTKQSGLNIDIVPCPIVRENSGLAMSSRNERLSDDLRIKAAKIYQILKKYSSALTINDSPGDIIKSIANEINKEDYLETEYIIFCDPETLRPIEKFEKNMNIRLCLAVWCKKVRLIDNISLHF
ncbi:MAG: pantoate--beta-alanine ligase [Bacteroidales bacterium]|jgi:pantoate--beta-alanine ligase|nr:pantoate--beta-alanine ligase [Bacteroidales bacterium]